MTQWLYAFEAKGIQDFILRSGRLVDMCGGSELVYDLSNSLLAAALGNLGSNINSYRFVSKAAGAGRIVFSKEDDAKRLFQSWPLLVERYAPGIQVIQAIIEINGTLFDALDKLNYELARERNRPSAALPEIGPLVERAPRTGLPATEYDHIKGELLDRGSFRQRAAAPGRRHRGDNQSENGCDSRSLIERFSGQAEDDDWPVEFDVIVKGTPCYLAIVHADGNNLGSAFMKLGRHIENSGGADAERKYLAFSKAVSDAAEAAAQEANRQVIESEFLKRKNEDVHAKRAARPLILGGDDITLAIRSDLAFEFTRIYLEQFEVKTRHELAKFATEFGVQYLPDVFTACAGIACVKSHYPFSRGYELAEDLVKFAKAEAKLLSEEEKPVASCLAFHRVTTSSTSSYSAIRANELTSRDKSVRLWFGPYGVGDHLGQLTRYADLYEVSRLLDQLPGGSIRNLAKDLHVSATEAKRNYERILQVARDKDMKTRKVADALNTQLAGMTGSKSNPLWRTIEVGKDDIHYTPVWDAHVLRELSPLKSQEGRL